MDKSPDAFRTISEVAEALETPAHVLRFWETRFPQIRPVKRAGGRRYYRPSDLALLTGIKRLLHEEGMTIRGVQKVLREQGVRHVAGLTDEATAEEEALISAMNAAGKPHEAEVTRLTPREADQASIDALEAEARAAGTAGQEDDLSVTGTVIAFPFDTGRPEAAADERPRDLPGGLAAEPEDAAVREPFAEAGDEPSSPSSDLSGSPMSPSPANPRQISFPGFGPDTSDDDSLIAGFDSDDELPSEADSVEDAPFAFDTEPEPEEASADTDAGDTVVPIIPAPAEEIAALPYKTIAARLRALPPGRLPARNEALRGLARRLHLLRARLDAAQRHPD